MAEKDDQQKYIMEPSLTTNNVDRYDVGKIELDLTIPFISVPIKKLQHSNGLLDFPVANINAAGLALGGAIVLGTTVILPFLAKSFTENHLPTRYAKILDNAEFGAEPLIDFAGQMFNDKRNLHGCMLRIACWTTKDDYIEPGKLLKFMTSNKVLSMIANSTAVEDAILSGLNGRDCDFYRPCPVKYEYLDVLMKNTATASRRAHSPPDDKLPVLINLCNAGDTARSLSSLKVVSWPKVDNYSESAVERFDNSNQCTFELET